MVYVIVRIVNALLNFLCKENKFQNNMFKTYKITNNITSKIYFGYTRGTIRNRLSGHYSEPRNTLISRSLRKYGKANHTIELIQEYTTKNIAKRNEIKLIATNKTNRRKYPNGNGLNMTDGGEGAYGYKHTKILRAKWKRERKGTNTGPRLSLRGASASNSRPVFQFTLDGKLLKEYVSIREAAHAIHTNEANISKCCLQYKSNKTVKGFYFSFINKFKAPKPHKHYTKIYQLDVDTNKILKTHSSIEEASKAVGLSNRSGIDKCLMGWTKKSGGFKWKRA